MEVTLYTPVTKEMKAYLAELRPFADTAKFKLRYDKREDVVRLLATFSCYENLVIAEGKLKDISDKRVETMLGIATLLIKDVKFNGNSSVVMTLDTD